MSEIELIKRDCEYCGGHDQSVNKLKGYELYQVVCYGVGEGCNSSGQTKPTYNEAVTAWNTRPRQSELEGIVRELVGALKKSNSLLGSLWGDYGGLRDTFGQLDDDNDGEFICDLGDRVLAQAEAVLESKS